MPSAEEIALAKKIISGKLAAKEKMIALLKEADRLRKTGRDASLAQLLLERGVLTAQQLRSLGVEVPSAGEPESGMVLLEPEETPAGGEDEEMPPLPESMLPPEPEKEEVPDGESFDFVLEEIGQDIFALGSDKEFDKAAGSEGEAEIELEPEPQPETPKPTEDVPLFALLAEADAAEKAVLGEMSEEATQEAGRKPEEKEQTPEPEKEEDEEEISGRPLRQYVVGPVVGRGAFGALHLSKDENTGKRVLIELGSRRELGWRAP